MGANLAKNALAKIFTFDVDTNSQNERIRNLTKEYYDDQYGQLVKDCDTFSLVRFTRVFRVLSRYSGSSDRNSRYRG